MPLQSDRGYNTTIAEPGVAPKEPPLNGQEFWALGMALSTVAYLVVSVLDREKPKDLDERIERTERELSRGQDWLRERVRSGRELLQSGSRWRRRCR